MPKAVATVRLIEIADLLGVSKQRAHQIAGKSDFPAPAAEDIKAGFGIGERSQRGRSRGAPRNRGGR